MVSRADLLRVARSWEGVPYHHQGRNRNGVDCIGLILVTAWELGITDYNIRGYGRVPNSTFLRDECNRMMDVIPNNQAQPGDVLLLRFTREPQHLAFKTERGMLHSYASAGKVVETYMPPSWQRRIVASYAIRGVE